MHWIPLGSGIVHTHAFLCAVNGSGGCMMMYLGKYESLGEVNDIDKIVIDYI